MKLLEQCQKWNEEDEFQKIINTLEAIPAGERTPEMDSELARAYSNLAEPGDRELFQRAIGLLEPHEARPGDTDTQELIDSCRRCLALPGFEKNFRQRTKEAWAAFAGIEPELRRIMDTDEMRERGEELVEECQKVLELAFCSPSFELAVGGEKYELILSADGNRSALFPLVYFQRRAPESVLEHWNILVGRQPSAGFSLQAGELQVQAEDVLVWTESREDRVSLALYCEKLLPLMKAEEDKVWWLLCTLTDQVLGEVSSIALIHDLDIAKQPRSGAAVLLSELPGKLRDMGYTRWDDAGDYLENSYIAYELEPVKDPEADWRLDVGGGSTRLPVLINDYMRAESGIMDDYHRDGIAAGFLCYPLDGFTGEGRAEEILTFRDALREAVREYAGEDAVTFLGGATGLYYGYLDLIAWDLSAVLDAAREFFAGTDLAWGGFHVFRRDVGAVRLWEQEGEPQVDAKTGSLLSAQDIETLESFEDGISGYFGKMLQWLEDFIERGVETGRFTSRQARQDLKIALWYSYACNNLDEYRYYYKAVQWMKDSEKNAGGCATWYYRYSVALMYCGRLEEALDYAEKGIREEPDYPWIWLQAAKLRSHSGDKAGALEAVAHGLKREPGDHEFLTLKREIEAGEPLERMEYHWIDPGADRNLQQGLDEDADEKQRSISCITVNREGLERFWNIFGPKPEQYAPNGPFTQFPYTVNGQTFDLVFQMNEAGMSSLSADWLERLAGWLKEGRWLEQNHPDGRPARLDTVLVGLDYHMGLVYHLMEEDEYFQIFLRPDGTEKEGAFWSSKEGSGPGVYTIEEMEAVEEHIQKYFGEIGHVFHELVSPAIHVDICVVPPDRERNYYTLVTMGMGARQMQVPEELAEYRLERAELAIALPPDWRMDEESMKDERWYWPVRLLKVLARLPIRSDTWLGWGHTTDNQRPFAEDTKLCGAILAEPQNIRKEGFFCHFPGGEEINFYQVIPLYREELEYKLEHNAEALLEKLAEADFAVHPDRPCCLTDRMGRG